MKTLKELTISYVRNWIEQFPSSSTIQKIDNGYLYKNKFHTTIGGVLVELNKDITKELN